MPESPTGVIISWSAYEHEHIERESDWFWALGITAVCAAVISVIFQDALFAVVIIVAAVTLALLAQTPPELTEFEISKKGIRVGHQLHRFEEIISFWVEDEHESDRPHLLIDTVKVMSPNLIIPLEHADAHQIHAFLVERVPEVRMKEPFAHKIIEFFGL